MKTVVTLAIDATLPAVPIGNAVVDYQNGININKDKLDEIVKNLESKQLVDIIDIESINTLLVDSTNQTATIVADVDAYTNKGPLSTQYTFKFNSTEELNKFMQEHSDSEYSYSKDIKNIRLSGNEVGDLLDSFVNVSKNDVIEYSPITIEQDTQLQFYRDAYVNSIKSTTKSR